MIVSLVILCETLSELISKSTFDYLIDSFVVEFAMASMVVPLLALPSRVRCHVLGFFQFD